MALWGYLLVTALYAASNVLALDNGLARTPPMGWISRQRFGCNVDCRTYPDDCISERLVKSTADAMVARGLLSAGYRYLVVHDCWMDPRRASDGKLRGDVRRFPSGMRSVADYVHSKGLKFGLYVDVGDKTCGGLPGSLGNYSVDTATLADWGVDYVTAGACGVNDARTCRTGYLTFGQSLNKTGRPMVFACDWPQAMRRLGHQANLTEVVNTCNQYRTYEDVNDNWESLHSTLRQYANYNPVIVKHSGPGSFNDPDELVIGDFGLSVNQQRLQMSLWSVMSAPLLVSADLRSIAHDSLRILLNKIALLVDQDPLGELGLEVRKFGEVHLWRKSIKPVGSFAIAVVYTSISGGPSRLSVLLSDIGLSTAARYQVTEAFTGQSYGIMKPWYTLDCEVNPNGAKLFVFIALP